ATATTRISPTAARIEYSINCGGMVEISLNAISTTSRGWILGFSSFRGSFCGKTCSSGRDASSGSGAGGVKTGSLRGGISARSEKLLPDEPAAGSAIIGSKATRGECRSDSRSTTAADKTGPRPTWDSGAVTSKSLIDPAPQFGAEFASESEAELVPGKREALPPVAAAAAALVSAAGGWAGENTGASIFGETGLGATDGAEGSGLAVLEADETNLLAAAARAARLTETFGDRVVFLVSVAVFLPLPLPLSLHFSRSTTSSRAL